jgi:hypothetical protein
LGNLRIDEGEGSILKWILKTQCAMTWTGIMWLGERDKWLAAVNMECTFGFYKMKGISCLAEKLV